ncbi:iron-containing redox enzyme family protein [Actinokineospora bangkokensis]|uniref:Iron-containing redox enzyme family protein n=1 Tax=Actinokineospora bangkokensis TaxID=1193682 RepID=A0A1Q9LMN4_9PSEU|nr:iron-containing redox enzyme family protein [Actinokineospora bangkokensis]OLR93307.1 hypothetical protein BJP25_17680 [Actinokineospora bangkokensis]
MTAAAPTGTTTADASPALPCARGELSAAVLAALREPPGAPLPATGEVVNPLGEDAQLALHVCYELHYRGWAGVDPAWEWDPGLLAVRARLEAAFLEALRAGVRGGADVADELGALLVEPVPGNGVSHFLRDEGEWWHVREYFAHRSVYHLKEADPHAWAIPRLHGRPKAALVAVEFDEYGGGRAERVHAQLYADLLVGAGLDPGYLHYLDHAPAQSIATVNMMSLFGLHRRWRAALVGHFAAAEISTGPSAQRMAAALRRLGADPACTHFYTEHIEADAVHEQVMRTEVVGGLLDQQPDLAADVVFGAQATDFLEARLAEHLMGQWSAGRSSLLLPL